MMTIATVQEAYDLMEELGISYQRFDHRPLTSVKDTEDIDWPGPQVKNLLLKTKKGREFFLVILPDEKMADLAGLAEALGVKRLSFASAEELESLMWLQPGSVTPLTLHHDTEKRIQVVIDASVDHNDTVGFHPNINSTTLIMPFRDFERYLEWAEHPPIYKEL